MKQTPFISKHLSLGAKMMEFAGYTMPVFYTGIKEEHLAVRDNAGVFDVSHMGEFILKGPKAVDLIQKLCSNDASKLSDGKVQYSCLINEDGGIVDDLLVYCLEQNKAYMLVVNAANIQKDWDWIRKWNTGNVELYNISDRTCQLAIQGPNVTKWLQPLTGIDLSGLKYYTFEKGVFAGVENVLISATGYTGSGGVEIYFENKDDHADKIWEALFQNKEQTKIIPAGLGARDTLRLEMGYCLYGNDMDDTITPLEAGLGWITKFTKDFIGKTVLEKQKENGITKKLVGFELTERGIPRHGYALEDRDGNPIGRVTSGTQSPSLNKAIGLGYVKKEFSAPGTEVFVNIRDKKIKAQTCKLPFS